MSDMTFMTEPFPHWTIERVLGLTLNSATAMLGQHLAQRVHWGTLGRDETRIWGTGPDDLQTAVHLSSLQIHSQAMTCSCRAQMPCAHNLALLLLLIQDAKAFPRATVPIFVRDKLPVSSPSPKADEIVRPDIQRGLLSLDHWLMALMARGLGEAQVRDFDFWDDMANRMLAAWMPGLSQWLREAGRRAVYADDWVEPLLEELGRMYLLVRSFDRFDQLPVEVQADIRDAIGWRLPEGEREHITDDWFVLGQRQRTLVNEMPEQFTWLYGLRSKRMALLYSLGPEEIVQTAPFVVGATMGAEVAYLPSRVPLKAQLIALAGRTTEMPVQGFTIGQAVEGFGLALARNPWLRHYPLLLEDVYMARFNKGWVLRHADGTYLPIAPYFRHKWVLHGIGGGAPMRVGATWDGHVLFPVSATTAAGTTDLNQIAAYTMVRQGIKSLNVFS